VVVPISCLPVRQRPSHRSEQVTEWILGEILSLGENEGGWVRAVGPDGYEGWVPSGPFEAAVVDASAWEREATLFSIGTGIAGARFERLPWGARLRQVEGGRVALPDGREVVPDDGRRLVGAGERELLFPPVGAALVGTARDWLGVPYSWGGRSERGADCSGFVQSVFRLHGVSLPRDSRQQRAVGEELVTGARPREGDLLFFAPGGGPISHVAVSTGGSRIIHAASGNGGVREEDLGGNGPSARLLKPSVVAVTRLLAG